MVEEASGATGFSLPEAGPEIAGPVKCWAQGVAIPTYLPMAADRNPMFLEKRVYQGSSGKVYPLPFVDRISTQRTQRVWQAVHIENEFLRVMVLPELGGRIHVALDKTAGYDLVYRQNVIKPALVGLTGPWISGGIEFNWPQHHRPGTFLPVEFEIEEHEDGSKTIWCGDHDPMQRMKGMHGVCLHPGRAVFELKVRAHNRTAMVQTFLWWANVAVRVHEGYQSFFPPDVYYVADHARRSMSEYPLAKGFYYGVDYGKRGKKGIPNSEKPRQFVPPHCRDDGTASRLPKYAANDLSFYANIPTPCSYMCMGSREDFFGGYDHKAGAGIVHVANHPISPGKKQWTWGNHKFGYAWDRNLTEPDRSGEYGPYIEIMAGVYTDNQPDFSFLMPGETKSWSQFWYAIHQIGAAQQANVDAAISLESEGEGVRIGVAVSRAFAGARILLTKNGETLAEFTADLAPGRPVVKTIERGTDGEMLLRVMDSGGGEIISYQPRERVEGVIPAAADEPAAPKKIGSVDELFVTGMHLQQYRHATVSSTLYWREGLRRDAGDSRCNNAMGVWHMKRGEFAEAEKYFRQAIARLTRRNANPYDGEAFYNLGLSLRYQMAGSMEDSAKFEEAYAALFKATWNQAWASAAFHALGEMDCRRQQWDKAVEHLDRSLRLNSENLVARNLVVMGLRKLGRNREADSLLGETREMDRLDVWGRVLAGQEIRCDLQARLDVAHDLARAGFFGDAIDLLRKEGAESRDWPSQSLGAEPMVHFTLGWLFELSGKVEEAREEFARGAAARGDYCFPSRVEEIAVLEKAMRSNSADARAPYYLGNLLYDRRRHEEAISLWEKSAKIDPEFSIVWRNLGIGYFNIKRKPQRARRAYDEAFKADPDDARVIFERDQLWKRVGVSPRKRLKELEKYPQLVRQRDDLSVELCALLNQAGRHEEAMAILKQRTFQPWEGGEGAPLGQHVRTHLMLGRKAMKEGDLAGAKEYFDEALETPANLGEARHLLANQSDVHFWLGEALHGLGGKTEARRHWKAAADFKGDFQQMSVRAFSEMTYYSALAMRRLGRGAEAKKLLKELLAYARKLGKAEAKIDYFATSLPTMLIFEDDLQYRQLTTAMFLEAQARLGLGKKARARQLLKKVLKRNPSHALAADLAVEIKQ